MTSSLSGSEIQASQSAILFDRTLPGVSVYQQLFQVPLGEPARIEAVYFNVQFDGQPMLNEAFVLSFNQPDGSVIWKQQTPFVGNSFSIAAEVTYARGNTESAQVPAFLDFDAEEASSMFLQPPLPDLVLPALSTVNLALYENNTQPDGVVTVYPFAVTYTPGAGSTSVTSAVQGIPLLTATDSG